MKKLLTALVSLGLVLSSASAHSADDGSDKNEIIVDGQQIQKRANDFVVEVTKKTSTDQYARFEGPLCAQIIGYDRVQAETILARMNSVAEASGIGVGKAKCEPNVVVVLTDEPDALLNLMARRGKASFIRIPYSNAKKQEQAKRPVRWWHNVGLSDSSGRRLNSASMGVVSDSLTNEFTSGGSSGRPEKSGAGMVSSTNSLIVKSTAASIQIGFVLVNTKLTEAVPLPSLADFISFVSMSQIKPDYETVEIDTILNLFAAPPNSETVSLSQWDLAYLQALKDAPANRTAMMQRSTMARAMRDDMENTAPVDPIANPAAPLPQ